MWRLPSPYEASRASGGPDADPPLATYRSSVYKDCMGKPIQEPTFLILTALAGRPLHGYGVIADVQELSDGQVRLRAGTLYAALDRLLSEGLIEAEREEVVDGRLRRYYRLTDKGTEALSAEAERLRHRAEVASRRLSALRRTPGTAPLPGAASFA